MASFPINKCKPHHHLTVYKEFICSVSVSVCVCAHMCIYTIPGLTNFILMDVDFWFFILMNIIIMNFQNVLTVGVKYREQELKESLRLAGSVLSFYRRKIEA